LSYVDSFWDSLDAVRGLAGDDIDTPRTIG